MKILSLGMGVQSTALYYLSAMGRLPRVDAAIFADPGAESTATYSYLDQLLKWADENGGPPIIVRRDKNLYEDLLLPEKESRRKGAFIPAYTKNQDGSVGMLRRQCTSIYKIEVVNLAIRQLAGLRPRQRWPKGTKIEVWKGISFDEMQRLSAPREHWAVSVYPLCGLAIHPGAKIERLGADRMYQATRAELSNFYRSHGLPIPPKSACVFCPFHDDKSWAELKKIA